VSETAFTERFEKILQRSHRTGKMRVRPADIKQLDSELGILKEIYNDAWEQNWGFVPMTEEEIDEFWHLKTFKMKFQSRERLAKYLKKLGRGFDVKFIDNQGNEKQTVMIHRTILGSMERFFGVLIEHFAGAFPLWLAPVQIVLIPIGEKHLEYAKKLEKEFRTAGIRVETDDRSERMQAKIRDHTLQKVPYLGIIGDKEADNKDGLFLSVRTRESKDLGQLTLPRFLESLKEQIEKKS